MLEACEGAKERDDVCNSLHEWIDAKSLPITFTSGDLALANPTPRG